MGFIRHIFSNHVFANLVFILILAVGALAFSHMPREQDPEINFNWIDITTVAPGMASADVEKRVTDVLEDAIEKVSDVRFVSSNSRESVSSILVRFEDVGSDVFDKRVIDLRREIQNTESQLPDETESPFIFEVTTANAMPTATMVVSGPSNDENLRRQTELVITEVERIKGVDRIITTALHDPELHVDFDPQRLVSLGISPTQLADTVALYYQDISAGSKNANRRAYNIRLTGTSPDPAKLAQLPVFGVPGNVLLGDIAEIKRSTEKPRQVASYNDRAAVILSITKKANSNTLDLVERLNTYIDERKVLEDSSGIQVILADDRTEITRNALNIMQNNALLGLFLVLLTTWLFLGLRIAILTSMGIPFILAATFWILDQGGNTLNVSVLLGVVISLGMLVDDAVVVAEGVYYRLQRGMNGMDAAISTLREVAAPVTAAVLTTIAAFLPLMLLPGILGKFMKVIPIVVSTALAVSLIEAFWMLPVHIHSSKVDLNKPSRVQAWRVRWLQRIRIGYTRTLIKGLRWPKTIVTGMVALFIVAVFSAFAGQANPTLYDKPVLGKLLLKTDFFASDPLRLYYINIEMQAGTPLDETLDKVREVERLAKQRFQPGEIRSVVSYAGIMFTEMAPFSGPHYGQILVTLNPKTPELRSVNAMTEDFRPILDRVAGPKKAVFLKLSGGPPTAKAISVKVRGDDITQLRAASLAIQNLLSDTDWALNIADDDTPGIEELIITLDSDAINRSGILPTDIRRVLRLMVNGEIVSSMQDHGEKLLVRVKAKRDTKASIEEILTTTLTSANGEQVELSTLVNVRQETGFSNIRHYNYRRTITVEADIDKSQIDTKLANAHIQQQWQEMRTKHPTIDLDFTGELDDLNESINSIFQLMLFGVLLMYAILGTQFRSYFQPLLILITVPMAFTGVVLGLLATQNPLSLYTLYGVVALAGIAVNSAIVLISAANQRLSSQMSVLHATIYAARRRVIPILITSMTTIAGLMSLALGLGGKSLLWGPIATAIVWGLGVSTILTLFVVPILYRLFMRYSHLNVKRRAR